MDKFQEDQKSPEILCKTACVRVHVYFSKKVQYFHQIFKSASEKKRVQL